MKSYLKDSAAWNRRRVTHNQAKQARKVGTVHPRGLARSVAKAYLRENNSPEHRCGTYFRVLFDKIPRRGKKYLLSAAERAERSGGRVLRKV